MLKLSDDIDVTERREKKQPIETVPSFRRVNSSLLALQVTSLTFRLVSRLHPENDMRLIRAQGVVVCPFCCYFSCQYYLRESRSRET